MGVTLDIVDSRRLLGWTPTSAARPSPWSSEPGSRVKAPLRELRSRLRNGKTSNSSQMVRRQAVVASAEKILPGDSLLGWH
jgi:hypothetical protein